MECHSECLAAVLKAVLPHFSPQKPRLGDPSDGEEVNQERFRGPKSTSRAGSVEPHPSSTTGAPTRRAVGDRFDGSKQLRGRSAP